MQGSSGTLASSASSLLPTSDPLTSIKSSLELEERRRTFWYCHVCCLISSNLDLWAPMVLPPSEITASYPCDEELWLSANEHTIFDNPGIKTIPGLTIS